MAELDKWDSFYVIAGSAAGALIGLQFVVMTLIAERPPSDGLLRASQAFGTPTIVHFSAVLLLSALLRVPWGSFGALAIACAIVGICGALYILLTARRMHIQTSYVPDFEDRLFHIVLPFVAYAGLAAAAYWGEAKAAQFGIAAATLVLLFTGIHNAWDAVSYHVLVSRRRRD